MPVTVQGMPACLRALAAAAMLIELSTTITLGHPTILYTSHNVLHLLKGLHTQHMSAQRLSGYEALLLSNPSLQIKYTPNTGGPAPILKGPEDSVPEEHDCTRTIQSETSPRPDMLTTPVPDADVVFVDGSCSRPNDQSYKLATQ